MTAQPDRTGPSRDGASRVPLVAHPAFPAIVALWVGAALAIAGLALPLGFTVNLPLASAAALAGAVAGYAGALALRARAAARSDRSAKGAPTTAAAPNSAQSEDEDLVRLAAAQAPPGQRRRALTTETGAAVPSILEISALPTLEPLAPVSPAASAEPGQSTQPGPSFRTIDELAGSAALQLRAAPLTSLGVVQLVERFALALHHRRQREAAQGEAAAAPMPPHLPPSAPSAEPFDRGEARSEALVGQAPAPDLVDDPARWALPEPEGEGEHIDENLTPDPGAIAGYGSLVDMRPGSRVPPPLADFVRIDDDTPALPAAEGPQPVVVFPGQAVPAPPLETHLPGMDTPASAEETEAALRQALAALQRMNRTA